MFFFFFFFFAPDTVQDTGIFSLLSFNILSLTVPCVFCSHSLIGLKLIIFSASRYCSINLAQSWHIVWQRKKFGKVEISSTFDFSHVKNTTSILIVFYFDCFVFSFDLLTYIKPGPCFLLFIPPHQLGCHFYFPFVKATD